jgi:hypothetical protein
VRVDTNPTLSANHTSSVTAFPAYLDERNLKAKPYKLSYSFKLLISSPAIFTDILDFCARVLAIQGGTGRR